MMAGGIGFSSGLVNELRTSALEKPMPPASIARKDILTSGELYI